MALLARRTETGDVLAEAILAAELGEPCDPTRLSPEALRELFDAIGELRVAVPYATLRLLGRLGSDPRVEVRSRVARALGWFVEPYPEDVERLLLLLACDTSRKVRRAAAESLADLLPAVDNPWKLIESWDAHPDRAREALEAARRSLPPPLGV
jgi:hypothetical protein